MERRLYLSKQQEKEDVNMKQTLIFASKLSLTLILTYLVLIPIACLCGATLQDAFMGYTFWTGLSVTFIYVFSIIWELFIKF
ncbi:hypothetical protein Goe26_00410 [Bacillus phage vB_BsuM-Goe26]|nr:hypothetical protein Goe26_00410 [Bacillus phage vB_BsuM-Goe26]